MEDKGKLKIAVIIAISIIFFGGLLLYFTLPGLRFFCNTIYGDLIIGLVVLIVLIWIAFFTKNNLSIFEKIIMVLFIVPHIMKLIFDNLRITCLMNFIYALINIIVSLVAGFMNDKKKISFVGIFGILAFCASCTIYHYAEYLGNKFPSVFIIPSIVVAIIAFILCLIYGIKSFRNNRSLLKMIGIPLFGLLGGFCITFLTLGSMNVYLDFSKPQYAEFIIIEKDKQTGDTFLANEYNFVVKKDEEQFDIRVDEIAYYEYEIGDEIILAQYQGAFRRSYYIFEDNVSMIKME